MRKIMGFVAAGFIGLVMFAVGMEVASAADSTKKVPVRPASDEHAKPSTKAKVADKEDPPHEEAPARKSAPAVRGATVHERSPAKNSDRSVEAAADHAAPAPKTVPAAAATEEADSFSVNELWADLAAGNQRFVAGRPQAKELLNRRAELAGGQHPQVIVVGCADSRCIPEVIFDKNLGELFVVRTAGNVADPVALGSIEYAAEHLHAKVLVILGHTKCGAVAAAAAGGKLPSPNLEAIVAKISPALEDLRGTATGDELAKQGVPANVHQSADDIVKNSRLIRSEVMSGRLRIIKAVYNIETGEVERLP